MFCAPGLTFGGTDGAGFGFLVLLSQTRFQRYRACRVPFSCFTLPNPFSAVSTALGTVFMFCAPGLGFGGTEANGFCFHVLRSRTRFRRYRWRRVLFSCFALPDSFSTVPRALDPVFMFCAPESVFGVSEGVVSRFHVLRSRTRFWRYRPRRVPFSCFAVTDPFSAVSRESVPVFMFRAPGPVFNGTKGVGSRFHVLRSRTRFQRYGGRRFPFSCFAHPDPFSAVPTASGHVFMFCAP
jgi:hypothetical protein